MHATGHAPCTNPRAHCRSLSARMSLHAHPNSIQHQKPKPRTAPVQKQRGAPAATVLGGRGESFGSSVLTKRKSRTSEPNTHRCGHSQLLASWRTCALPGAPEKRPITLTRPPGLRLRQDLLRPLPRRRRHRLRRRRRLPPQRPNPRARRQPRRPRPRRPRPFPAGSTAPSRQTDNVFALIIHPGRPTTNRAPR